jgi:hypothetical protein
MCNAVEILGSWRDQVLFDIHQSVVHPPLKHRLQIGYRASVLGMEGDPEFRNGVAPELDEEGVGLEVHCLQLRLCAE